MSVSPIDFCPITKLADCRDRYCELHYDLAPVRLAPEAPAVCSGDPATCTGCTGPECAARAAGSLVIDTRHADAAYARQVADEAGPVSGRALYRLANVGKPGPVSAAPVGWDRIESGAEETDRAVSADFAAAHDAHMAATYRDPWQAMPTDDPRTGDPLTGVYGRTYAEGGWLLMQASGDMFGPARGHCPILLFEVTNERGERYASGAFGDARMTHVDTLDTWQGALSTLRARIDFEAECGYGQPVSPASTGVRCGNCDTVEREHCRTCRACPGACESGCESGCERSDGDDD